MQFLRENNVREDHGAGRAQLLYLGSRPFSARFYSAGKAQSTTAQGLREMLGNPAPGSYYVAVPEEYAKSTQSRFAEQLEPVFANRRYTLFRAYPGQHPGGASGARAARQRD